MSNQVTKTYSVAFKRQIVTEFEEGRWKSHMEANRFYGIGGASTITKWIARYGSEAYTSKRKVIRVETKDDIDVMNQMRQEIKELKSALSASSLERYKYQAYFELACERGGITDREVFKKKSGL